MIVLVSVFPSFMCFASLVCGYLACKSMGGELGVPTCIQVGGILIQQGGLCDMGCVKELDRKLE